MTTDPYVGMSAEDIARCKASDANVAAIIAGRRQAAVSTLATNTDPAATTRDNWAPLTAAMRERNRITREDDL